jgi:hypothetical protein
MRASDGLDPHRFGACSCGFIVAGTERQRNRNKVWPAGKRYGEGCDCEAAAAIGQGDLCGGNEEPPGASGSSAVWARLG